MKKRRIQYNEISEDIYGPKYWTKFRLILLSVVLVIMGFLVNFSLEEKINKWLLATLTTNDVCPITFDKIELSYFPPRAIVKKPIIQGICFGQINNKLPLKNFIIGLSIPSFYPPGIKLHLSLLEGKTIINLYPTLSFSTQFLDIEETKIDTKIFAPMFSDNQSSFGGILKIEGILKLDSGVLEDGRIHISSNDFYLPAQAIKGFEIPLLDIKYLDVNTHFTNKKTMQIDHIKIGKAGGPIEINLKGNLIIDPSNFLNSELQLSGSLKLSTFILTNFSFIKLFLPAENTSGTYQMKINGPLGNLGQPEIK